MEAEDVAERASSSAGALTANALASLSQLESLSTLDSLASSLELIGNAIAAAFPSDDGGGARYQDDYSGDGSDGQDDGGGPDIFGEETDMEDEAAVQADMQAWLEEHVFNEENLESSSDTEVVFLLHGNIFCEPEYNCSYSSCEEEPDEECIADVDAAQIRIKASPAGEDGVDLELLVGPNKFAPILLELRANGLAGEIDLGAAKAAVLYLDDVFGSGGEDDMELPSVLEGRLRAALTINGEQDLTLAFSVLQDVRIDMDGDYGPISIQAKAADPLASAHIQGLEGNVSLDIDANALDISLPYAEMMAPDSSEEPFNPADFPGAISIHLGGASFSLDLNDKMQELKISNLGLGSSSTTIKKDSTTLFSLDLNADSGRALDLTITTDSANDSALFSVDPGLELSLKFSLNAIADDLGEDFPSFLGDETYTIALTGSGGASMMPVAGNDIGFGGGIKVVSGALSLDSTTAEAVEVAAGMCLAGRDSAPVGSHELLGHFYAAECQ